VANWKLRSDISILIVKSWGRKPHYIPRIGKPFLPNNGNCSEALFNHIPLLFLDAINKPIFTRKIISIIKGDYIENSTNNLC